MTGAGRHRRPPASRRRTSFAPPPPSRLQRFRSVSALLAASIGLTVAAAWFVPRFLDWGQYRAAVEAVASAGLGRPVRIAGPIRLSLLPEATLVAGDVTLPDTGDGASATASQLRLRVALGALMAGRIEPQDLVLRSAHMRLPWPLTALVSVGLVAPAGLHARVEDSTLAIGGLQVTAIDGELRVDPTTGLLSAAGLASVMERAWQMTGRLGRAGADGSATVEITLDGQGSAVGTGGTLSGQIAPDGGLAGRVSGRGPDLSLLLPAPGVAWKADGQIKAGSGLVMADDLELDIGDSPAKGAVALRLLPQLRLDAALATSHLDLGAWLPPLLHGERPALPTGIELSADAAQLAGGTLRHLRTGFAIASDGVTLREAEAELPGRATLHLAGRLSEGHFNGEARIAAPDMPQTLAWLRPEAPAVVDALPPGAWQAATLSATVSADASSVALAGLAGDVNGTPLAGDLVLRGGARPALRANLRLTRPVLDNWLPAAPAGLAETAGWLTALPRRFAGFDADVAVTATSPSWHNLALGRLDLDARCNGGTLNVRRAVLTAPDLSLAVAGAISPEGSLGDARLDLSLGHAEILPASLPAEWQSTRALFQGPLTVAVLAAGSPGGLAITAAAELSDARVQTNGTLDLPGRHWRGGVSLHHPGATRLLYSVGLGDTVGWLGDGSLSLQAAADAAADHVSLSGLEVSAGSLRLSGDLAVTGLVSDRRAVSGTVNAETLPIPRFDPRSTAPWTLTALHGADARLSVRAGRLLWGSSPFADDAAAMIRVTNGALRLDGFTARVAGGTLTGQMSLDDTSPPRLALSAKLVDALLDGPVAGTPVDLAAGRVDAAADLAATGYSPAGMLATADGPVQATVRDGALEGLDAGRILAALRMVTAPGGATAAPQPGVAETLSDVAAALGSGATPVTRLELQGTLSHGTMTLSRGDVATPAGSIAVTGTFDVPEEAVDARLALRPALEAAPDIGLRLIGPAAAPSDSPELADLTRWLADR